MRSSTLRLWAPPDDAAACTVAAAPPACVHAQSAWFGGNTVSANACARTGRGGYPPRER